VIATATNTVVAIVPVGTRPQGVVITPDGAYAYVANQYSGTVSVIATATNTVVDTISGLAYPAQLSITPDGAYAYVVTAAADTVSVIATATNTVVDTIPVQSWPIGIGMTPDGAYVYAENQFSNTVSVIATATNTVVATVPVGSDPVWAAVAPSYRTATTTTLSSSPNPSTYGEAVTFTAVVSSSQGAPPDGETVSFMKGKKVLGTGTLSAGSATFTTLTLKVGTTTVKAVYAGDSNFANSTSKPVKQVVEDAGE
jgi:YVTN family beta-propeller protein